MMDQQGYLPTQIHMEHHSSVKPCPVIFLCIFCISFALYIPLGVMKVLMLLRHICLMAFSQVLWHLQLWWLGFPCCPSCRQLTGPAFLLWLDTIFQPISLLQIGTRIQFSMLSWALLSSQPTGPESTTLPHFDSQLYSLTEWYLNIFHLFPFNIHWPIWRLRLRPISKGNDTIVQWGLDWQMEEDLGDN